MPRYNEQDFWQRIDEARLLLTRLNDEDLACPNTRALLVRRYSNPLEACLSIYTAWCYIAIRVKKFLDKEFELDPWWEQRFVSCSEHIFDRCLTFLKNDEKTTMDLSIMTIFSEVLSKMRYGKTGV